MKTLSKNQIAELNKGVKSVFNFLLKGEKTKAEKQKDSLIQKFDKENVESAFNAYVLSQKESVQNNALILIPQTNVSDALSNAEGISDAEINNELLSALNAIGISDSIKEKGGKSIFKKEFNNKADRTKCRNAFQNALSLYLLHLAKNKMQLADEKLIEIKSIAEKYYIAGASFKNKSDYCTDNMDANKKELISLFISSQQSVIVD